MSYYPVPPEPPKFRDSRGNHTSYALACGRVQSILSPDGKSDVELWHEHGAYHVRAYNRDGVLLRLSWESFRTLGEARKQYRALVRAISKPW